MRVYSSSPLTPRVAVSIRPIHEGSLPIRSPNSVGSSRHALRHPVEGTMPTKRRAIAPDPGSLPLKASNLKLRGKGGGGGGGEIPSPPHSKGVSFKQHPEPPPFSPSIRGADKGEMASFLAFFNLDYRARNPHVALRRRLHDRPGGLGVRLCD
jgi:hypothetical protein